MLPPAAPDPTQPRIYDLTHNHEDPEQTYFFLDDTTSKSVAAVENAKAVSFTFGGDNGYWGPFTIMILLSNGDVYTACPIMPKTRYCIRNN